jgi:hypothetical protein
MTSDYVERFPGGCCGGLIVFEPVAEELNAQLGLRDIEGVIGPWLAAELCPKLLTKSALSGRRHGDRARAVDAPDPILCEAVRAKGGSDRAREMRAPLAPVEAGPAPDARRASATAADHRIEADAEAAEKFDAGLGDQPGFLRQLDTTARSQRVSEGYAETPGEMVVAGPRRAQSRIARADRQWWPLRIEPRSYLRDALDHLSDGG